MLKSRIPCNNRACYKERSLSLLDSQIFRSEFRNANETETWVWRSTTPSSCPE